MSRAVKRLHRGNALVVGAAPSERQGLTAKALLPRRAEQHISARQLCTPYSRVASRLPPGVLNAQSSPCPTAQRSQ